MNRSEELCKLLGIEPNWVNITCKGLECKNKCNLFVLPSDKCRKIEKGEPCQHIYRYKEIYPDLTTPSNFMKLLDLLNAYLDIRCDCLMAVVPQIIGKAIFLASTNSSRFIDKKDKFKKQAQATKWDY